VSSIDEVVQLTRSQAVASIADRRLTASQSQHNINDVDCCDCC